MTRALPSSKPYAISRAELRVYVALTAQLRQVEGERDELRERILEKLKRGVRCPRSDPYLLVHTESSSVRPAWKQHFFERLQIVLGTPAAALAEIQRIESATEPNVIDRLEVRPNPDFQIRLA